MSAPPQGQECELPGVCLEGGLGASSLVKGRGRSPHLLKGTVSGDPCVWQILPCVTSYFLTPCE